MKRSAMLLGFLLSACGVGARADSTPEKATQDEATIDGAIDAAGDKATGGTTCAHQGQFDFHIKGNDLAQWEGRRVVAAAFENLTNQQGNFTRPVLISGKIQNGDFSVYCSKSLTETYNYPAAAAFIDLDGNGRCSADDVGYQLHFYGWNKDVDEKFPWDGSKWELVSSGKLVSSTWKDRTGDPVKDFCSDFEAK